MMQLNLPMNSETLKFLSEGQIRFQDAIQYI
jgi:hypothetical protein